MYTIKLPGLVLESGDGSTFGFLNFLLWAIAAHPSYNQNADGIRAACRLDRKLDELGDISEEDSPTTLTLPDEDWERLKNAVENPQGGYPVSPAHRILPFVDAVCDAERG